MIEGRTMVMGRSAVRADEGPLAERLGEGVGVGPAQGLGAGPTVLDELGPDPFVAQLLGPFGQEVGAGRAELGPGRFGELGQALGRRDWRTRGRLAGAGPRSPRRRCSPRS